MISSFVEYNSDPRLLVCFPMNKLARNADLFDSQSSILLLKSLSCGMWTCFKCDYVNCELWSKIQIKSKLAILLLSSAGLWLVNLFLRTFFVVLDMGQHAAFSACARRTWFSVLAQTRSPWKSNLNWGKKLDMYQDRYWSEIEIL